MGLSNDGPYENYTNFHRRQLLLDVAAVFKRAGKDDRCWLVEKIKEAQRRVHNKAKRDEVDEALAMVGEL